MSSTLRIEDRIIPAVDGYELSVRIYRAPEGDSRIILMNSAAGVKKKFYKSFCTFLAENGFTVFSYDYRGIGGSRPEKLRGFEAQMHEWGLLDMNGMMEYLLDWYPDSKLYYIGHSIGGQLLGMSKFNSHFTKSITVGSQEGYWKYWDGIWKLGMILFWYVIIPGATKLFGYFPAEKVGFAEDLPKGVALEWGKWGRNPNWFFDSVEEARENFPGLKGELLGISISDDNYAPIRSVNALMDRFVNTKLTRKHIQPSDYGFKKIGHFNPFRKTFKETIWKEMLEFLK